MGNSLLSLHDLTRYQFNLILDTARRIKRQPRRFRDRLEGQTLALICDPEDFRTRVSFQRAVEQLGGSTTGIPPVIFQSEAPRDIARTLECWTDGIFVKTPDPNVGAEMASAVSIPVFNGGNDHGDPVGGLTGIFTLQEMNRDLSRLKIALLDVSTCAISSWAAVLARSGGILAVAARPEDIPENATPDTTREIAGETGFFLEMVPDLEQTIRNADVLVTPEAGAGDFSAEQIESALAREGKPGIVVLSGLPARKKTDGEGPHGEPGEPAFEGMENKLHIQKAIVVLLYERQL